MKKRVLQWMMGVTFSALIVVVYLLLFQTHFFSKITIRMVNAFVLNPRGMALDGTITGGIAASHVGINKGKLTSVESGELLVYMDHLDLSGSDLDWHMHDLTIDHVTLQNYYFDVGRFSRLEQKRSSSNWNMNVRVRDFRLEQGQATYAAGDSLQSVFLTHIVGELWLLDGYSGIQIQAAELQLPAINPDTLKSRGRIGYSPGGALVFESLEISGSHGDLTINGELLDGTVELAVQGQGLKLTDYFHIQMPDYYKEIRLDTDLSIERSPEKISVIGSGTIHQAGARIPFEIYRFEQQGKAIRTLANMGSEFSYLGIVANIDSTGYVQGSLDLFRPELNPFIPIKDLDIAESIGTVQFSGRRSGFRFKPDIKGVMINDIPFKAFSTEVIYHNRTHLEVAPGSFKQGGNSVSFQGEIKNNKLDFTSALDVSDYSFLGRTSNWGQMDGNLDLLLQIDGNLKQPRFKGEFSSNGLGFKDRLELTGMGKYDLQLEQGRLLGEFALQGQEGFLFRDSLKQFSITTLVTEDEYHLNELHLQAASNLVSLSGSIDPMGINIDKMNMIADGHQLSLVDSVKIKRDAEGLYTVPPALLSFNQGGFGIAGNYSMEQGYRLKTAFEMLDLGQLMEFLRLKLDFKGSATGKARIEGALFDPTIYTDFTLLGGSTLGYPSDSAFVKVTVSKQGALANEIKAYVNGGKLRLDGQLPWGYGVRGNAIGTTPQNFSVNVENYDLADLKFTEIAGQRVSGRATGTVTLRGTPIDTKLDGRLHITRAKYDTLSFAAGYIDFGYEDNLLTFDSLSMVSTWGYGSGTGYMPLSLDIIAEDRLVTQDRDIGLQFDFNLNEMPFLTSYISSVDVLRGDYIGELNFSGPFSAPIRNGKLRGHNGYLEVSVLGNPITDIHSEVTLRDNTLTIDHFSGRMLFSEGSALNVQGAIGFATGFIGDLIGVKVAQEYEGRVTATGQINIDSFFEPIFNVNLKAKEVYYRSTDGLIEAIADGKLHFSGQDTLDVTAIIPVKRAVYYSNFESVESYKKSISQIGSSLFRYSLNTQFPSDLLISNDQMEAEFEGELWLLDYGDGIMRFSGQLTAVEGGKFYYLGNELSIVKGEIIFNSVDFNPQLSMEASIEIDGEWVTLELTGDLDEPELVITSGNTQLTQSDILAYLTINQKLVEVSFDTQSALNPVKTYSEMLVEKQISKIAREFTGLDILDVGINLDSDTTAVSRFEVGQRLSKKLKVTYGGDLQPVDGKTDYDFGLEYRINQNVSVTSKINQDGEVELNGRLKFTY